MQVLYFVHSYVDGHLFGLFPTFTIVNSATTNICIHVFECLFSIPSGIYIGIELLGFVEILQTVSQGCQENISEVGWIQACGARANNQVMLKNRHSFPSFLTFLLIQPSLVLTLFLAKAHVDLGRSVGFWRQPPQVAADSGVICSSLGKWKESDTQTLTLSVGIGISWNQR